MNLLETLSDITYIATPFWVVGFFYLIDYIAA